MKWNGWYLPLLIPIGLASLVSANTVDDPWVPIKPPSEALRDRDRFLVMKSYRDAILRTAEMVASDEAQRKVRSHGLSLVNLTWEDTGRYKNSAVGPNISDMTIQVGLGREWWSMPVIRHDNFHDKTGDISPWRFTLLVGNQNGRPLQRVPLAEFLQTPSRFMSSSRNIGSLYAERDTHVLVSAQAAFLPVPTQGKATFHPVIFNYQSSRGNPAILSILATREGTSTTIIDNHRDGFSEGSHWGQRLFFNKNGRKAPFTGERLSDFQASGRPESARSDDGLSMVLLIQVPLKHTAPRRLSLAPLAEEATDKALPKDARRSGSDVEMAVIGHGPTEGRFVETDGSRVERDERFPIRVTVQFYKATSNGVLSQTDMTLISRQIESVYANASSVGSLVTGGTTGRPTEYWGMKVQPPRWWEDFWRRYERESGSSRQEAIRRLNHLLGKDFQTQPLSELYLRDILSERPSSR